MPASVLRPNTWLTSSTTATDRTICATATDSASRNTRRKPRSDSSMPMMNSSISTPSSARIFTGACSVIRPRPDGPTTTPAAM